jgi:hypothetical protein
MVLAFEVATTQWLQTGYVTPIRTRLSAWSFFWQCPPSQSGSSEILFSDGSRAYFRVPHWTEILSNGGLTLDTLGGGPPKAWQRAAIEFA